MDSLIFELQIVFYFQLFLSANVRHRFMQILKTMRVSNYNLNFMVICHAENIIDEPDLNQ